MAGWSDYGFPNKIFLSPPLPILTGLTAALNERLSVPGSSTIAVPLPLSPWNSTTAKAWFNEFDSKLNGTITRYVNHTINNGDFTGLDTIPMWTRETIYEYLNETELLHKDCILAPLLWSKYLLQKYRVINLLRWAINGSGTVENIRTFTFGQGTTWEQTISNFYSAIPYIISSSSPPEYYAEYTFGTYQLRTITWNITTVPFPSYAESDLYVSAIVPGSSLFFQPSNNIVSPSVLYLYSTFEESNQISESILKKTDFSEVTLIDPINKPGLLSIVPDFTTVLKFTGPNGFKFRGEDW